MTICARLSILGVLCAALTGCGGGGQASAPLQESGLKPISVFYGRFLSQHRGQPPKDEAEFKTFLATMPPEEWKGFKFENMDAAWNASRDKQPYVIVYGAAPAGPGLNGAPVIAYEKQGVGGKRYVASWNGDVQEVDEAKFKELVPTPAP
jgi:hypothetical protein